MDTTPNPNTWVPDTADWGMSEHLAAAAALGRFARTEISIMLTFAKRFPDSDPAHHAVYVATERVIVAAVQAAAGHAHAAENEAARVAAYLHPQTREYQEYMRDFPRRDPRD